MPAVVAEEDAEAVAVGGNPRGGTEVDGTAGGAEEAARSALLLNASGPDTTAVSMSRMGGAG